MSSQFSRRTLLKTAAYAGLTLPFINTRLIRAESPNGVLRHACFGAAGMAWADMTSLATHKSLKIVAVCDVDVARMGEAKNKFPGFNAYQDFRVLLDKEEKNFDSCNVTVPDNMHFPIAMSAVMRGKHVYCQKPMCHDIGEVRKLTEAAAKAKIVSQMGIQIHSSIGNRLAVQLVHDGAIGRVKRVFTWSNKNWGGGERPAKPDPVPANLDWNLWLGVAPERPYNNGIYHPSNWRRWLDFGTGTFGDMGCHIYDPVFGALGLTAPTAVQSTGPTPFKETWATSCCVNYWFPATPYTSDEGALVTWYDGSAYHQIPHDQTTLPADVKLPEQGSVIIGDKGTMVLPHMNGPRLYPLENYKDYKYPKLPGNDHWHQFVDACRGEGKTSAGFEYAGPLTESVLLGGVACRFPNQKLEWDAKALKFTNVAEANQYLHREYRKGFDVAGIA